MNHKVLCVAVVGVLFSVSATSSAGQNYTWRDYEITGQKNVSRKAIIAEIPIQLGTNYVEDMPGWQKICEKIKDKFGFHFAYCEAVRFLDGRAYFLVNIVEKGDESHLNYREPPTGHIALASPEIVKAYDALMARLWLLFSQGKNVGEKVNGDFLDFDDPEMHALVLELVKKVPSFRTNLIQVIREDATAENRAKAAWLLCWALEPQKSIAEVYQYMDDPTVLARNDIVRFMGHWIKDLLDEGSRKKIIDKLIQQMWHPSHGDRNKAIWNLLELAKSHSTDATYLKSRYLADIEYLADTSVLENVGGTAKELLAVLGVKTREILKEQLSMLRCLLQKNADCGTVRTPIQQAALVGETVKQHFKANRIDHDLGSTGSVPYIRILPNQSSALGRLSKELQVSGATLVFSPEYFLDHPYAAAAFDKSLGVLFLPDSSVEDLSTDDSALRHELVHFQVWRDFRDGKDSPYFGQLKGGPFSPEPLDLDEMKAYSEDLKLASKNLQTFSRATTSLGKEVASARLAEILQSRLEGKPPMNGLSELETRWDAVAKKIVHGRWHANPIIENIESVIKATQGKEYQVDSAGTDFDRVSISVGTFTATIFIKKVPPAPQEKAILEKLEQVRNSASSHSGEFSAAEVKMKGILSSANLDNKIDRLTHFADR